MTDAEQTARERTVKTPEHLHQMVNWYSDVQSRLLEAWASAKAHYKELRQRQQPPGLFRRNGNSKLPKDLDQLVIEVMLQGVQERLLGSRFRKSDRGSIQHLNGMITSLNECLIVGRELYPALFSSGGNVDIVHLQQQQFDKLVAQHTQNTVELARQIIDVIDTLQRQGG